MASYDRVAGFTSGVAIKAPCQYTTTGNITLSGLAVQANGTWASSLTQNDADPTRVLVKNQTNAVDNGIWNPGAGTWTRAQDFNGPRDIVQGTLMHVLQDGVDTFYEVTTASPVIGTSSLTIAGVQSSAIADILARLASTSSAPGGDALVGVKNTATGALATTQHQKNEDNFTAMDVIDDAYKAAIRAHTSTQDVATVMQAYLQWCYNNERAALIPAGRYSMSPISLACGNGELEGSLTWLGEGQNVTQIKQLGTSSTPLITVTGTSPPTTVDLYMSGITLIGNGKTCPGLQLKEIADFMIDRSVIRDFDIGLDCKSSLIGWIRGSQISRNNTGVKTNRDGSGTFCNLITVESSRIIFNTKYGLDIDDCDTLNICGGAQIESNGVTAPTATVTISNAAPAVVSWAGHPLVAGDAVVFTTSGALPAGLTASYIYYVLSSGLTANAFQVSNTVGGSAVNTSSAGSGTHTAVGLQSGGVVWRKGGVDELGAATVSVKQSRFEGNYGSAFRTESQGSTAFGVYVSMDDVLIAGIGDTANNQEVAIGSARKVSLKNVIAPVGSATFNVVTDQLFLENSKTINLVRPLGHETETTVVNSGFGGTDHSWGEKGSFTATLTGVSGTVTGTATYVIQGRYVDVTLPSITGTSNTTSATLTGMPQTLWPTITKPFLAATLDNGTDKISGCFVGTNGVITLGNAFSGVFTGSGTKGINGIAINWTK